MTETTLYNRARLLLGATILAPLAVGLLATTGAMSSQKPAEAIKGYLGMSVDQSMDKTSSDQPSSGAMSDEQAATDASNAENTSADTSADDQSSMMAKADAKTAGDYTVQAGDSYGCIAEHYYGSYEMWPQVYSANYGPGYEEYTLNVGAKLVMPASDGSLPKTSLCS